MKTIRTVAILTAVVFYLILLKLLDSSFQTFAPPELTVVPPKSLPYFSLGYADNLSDGLWLRVIQDIDICDKSSQTKSRVRVGINFLVRDGKELPEARCKMSWVYRMLDSITELTPDFRAPYYYGTVALSVLIGDRDGATALFEKAAIKFPHDWQLLYHAGYHFLYETNDPDRAATYLVMSAKAGAPPWVYALASRIYTKTGKALLGKSVLEEAMKSVDPNSASGIRLKQRLTEIDQILDEAKSNGR